MFNHRSLSCVVQHFLMPLRVCFGLYDFVGTTRSASSIWLPLFSVGWISLMWFEYAKSLAHLNYDMRPRRIKPSDCPCSLKSLDFRSTNSLLRYWENRMIQGKNKIQHPVLYPQKCWEAFLMLLDLDQHILLSVPELKVTFMQVRRLLVWIAIDIGLNYFFIF